jgi:hypothetical protein
MRFPMVSKRFPDVPEDAAFGSTIPLKIQSVTVNGMVLFTRESVVLAIREYEVQALREGKGALANFFREFGAKLMLIQR